MTSERTYDADDNDDDDEGRRQIDGRDNEANAKKRIVVCESEVL